MLLKAMKGGNPFVNQNNLQRHEVFGAIRPNPVKCMTCIFGHGEPPFEDMPDKAYCMIYTRGKGAIKPASVLFDGKDCIYYKDEV